LLWGGLADSAGDSQGITISANDAAGASHQQTVELTKTAATLDTLVKAVAGINDALQKSNDATLQQITAVAVNDNGVAKINFVSNLQSFDVSVGNTNGTGNTNAGASTTTGLYQLNSSNAVVQGFDSQSTQVGSGGTADISTQAGALTALTAISQAVNTLGTAQAAIGKGQNVFNYAISLAQSQITNFSSAQSQIRDADVAMEAANLTKAQVLQQASIAAMAQANSAPQALLKLLG
jgi:flagellin